MTTPSDYVGQRAREVRHHRGLTVAELATRCAATGAPHLTRSVIHDIENGRPTAGLRRRAVTVDELLALALVLNVAPVHLLVPIDGDGEPYPLTPTSSYPRHRVRDWIRGPFYGHGTLNDFPAAADSREYYSEVPGAEFAMARTQEVNRQPVLSITRPPDAGELEQWRRAWEETLR